MNLIVKKIATLYKYCFFITSKKEEKMLIRQTISDYFSHDYRGFITKEQGVVIMMADHFHLSLFFSAELCKVSHESEVTLKYLIKSLFASWEKASSHVKFSSLITSISYYP